MGRYREDIVWEVVGGVWKAVIRKTEVANPENRIIRKTVYSQELANQLVERIDPRIKPGAIVKNREAQKKGVVTDERSEQPGYVRVKTWPTHDLEDWPLTSVVLLEESHLFPNYQYRTYLYQLLDL